MKSYYTIGRNICSHLRSKGYEINFTQKYSWLTFYDNGEFLFSTTVDILPEYEVEKIIIEILKEKYDVSIPTKIRES